MSSRNARFTALSSVVASLGLTACSGAGVPTATVGFSSVGDGSATAGDGGTGDDGTGEQGSSDDGTSDDGRARRRSTGSTTARPAA